MITKIVLVPLGLMGALLLASFVFTHWQAQRISAAFPPRGEFADVAGARLRFTQVHPAGEATRTIVLIHGASGNEADMRVPLGERLAARGFRVISVDRPGHGWSTRDDVESTPARQALQIRQMLDGIGIKRAIIAGHSLAGAMTLQFALDHSDMVEGVVLLAPVTHPWPGGVAAYYGLTVMPVAGPFFTNTAMMPIALSVFDRSLEGVFAPQLPPPNYRGLTGVDLVLRPQTFRSNAQDVVGMLDFVTREQKRYPQIAVPVSIITGDRDKIVLTHVHSYGSQRDIPGAKLHVLEGVGHSPHWVRPEEVTQLIADFATGLRAPQATGR